MTSDTEHVEHIFMDGLQRMVRGVTNTGSIEITLFLLNWKLALLSMLPIPLSMVSASWFTKRVHGYYHDIRRNKAPV